MNILSMDGGGIFGLHTAAVLSRLEQALPGIIAKTDFFAGTSVGGILALGFANGATVSNILSLASNPAAFFTRSILREIESTAGIYAKYDNTGRQAVLNALLGTTTLGQLKKYVAIQSFQLNAKPSWGGAVFHNLPGGAGCTDSVNMLAVDAGMATTAAPTYFPSYNSYVDGGVSGSNNPANTALALAMDPAFTWKFAGTPATNIKMLSIGRSYPGDDIDRTNWDAGYIKWLPLILNLLLSGPAEQASYDVATQLGTNFLRHSPMVPRNANGALDAVTLVPDILSWANSLDLSTEITWLEKNW